MGYPIRIEHLSKRFPRSEGFRDVITFWRREYNLALRDVNLEIPDGGVFGILGPNGAGKTTLLKILAGLVLPDFGSVTIGEFDIVENSKVIKDHLTYIPVEDRSLYWRLTGRQNLMFYAQLQEFPRDQISSRVDEVLRLLNLEGSADERVVKYSTGMKQRLTLARGLLSDPSILVLDEPSRSLDPLGTRQLWRFIRDELVAKQRKTIIIATHDLEEANVLCDQVALMSQGEIRASGFIEDLIRQVSNSMRCVVTVDILSDRALDHIKRLRSINYLEVIPPNGHQNWSLEITLENPSVNLPPIVEALIHSGAKVSEVRQVKLSLSDVIEELSGLRN